MLVTVLNKDAQHLEVQRLQLFELEYRLASLNKNTKTIKLTIKAQSIRVPSERYAHRLEEWYQDIRSDALQLESELADVR